MDARQGVLDGSPAIPPAPTPPNPADSDPRKCWICFSDETEDTPLSSEWRSPCPCSLTAHESCLLDWIDDLDLPSSRRRRGNSNQIVCPQCKSPIQLARPYDPIVSAFNMIERRAERAAIPACIGVIAGCTWTGCLVYGMNTVYIIFGSKMGDRILGLERYSYFNPATKPNAWFRFLNPFVASTIGWSWRLAVGLPLIPLALVASRTKMAESLLPALPILFLATQSSPYERLDLKAWPPSPAMSVIALPYLRAAYNELYARIAAPYERRWLHSVKPRHRQTDDDGGVGRDAPDGNDARGDDPLAEDNAIFDIAIEIEQIDDTDDDDDDDSDDEPDHVAALPAAENALLAGGEMPPWFREVVAEAERQPGVPAVVPANANADADAIIAAPVAPAPAPANQADNIVLSASQLADTFIGALLFPTVSGLMGNLLQLVLPASWTTPVMPWERSTRAGGLLQAKWGRSLVGGCLFVVLKDAVTLWVRWKKARDHNHRTVLNCERVRGRDRRR